MAPHTVVHIDGDIARIDVTVTYLEFAPDALSKLSGQSLLTIEEVKDPDVPFYRFLYNTVGQEWFWWRKRLIADEELAKQISDPNAKIFVFYRDGKPFGYFDLDLTQSDRAEIAYFGLMPFAIGKGFGKEALAGAIRTASTFADRVTLNTCSADHPRALDNYLRAGFRVVGTAMDHWQIPVSLGFDLSRLVQNA